jgi:hypothetical protein
MAAYVSAFVRARAYSCARNGLCTVLRDYRDMWDELVDSVCSVGLCLVKSIQLLWWLLARPLALVIALLVFLWWSVRYAFTCVRLLMIFVYRPAYSDDSLRELISMIRQDPVLPLSDAYMEQLIRGNRRANQNRWWFYGGTALTDDELDRMQSLLKEERLLRRRTVHADWEARVAADRARPAPSPPPPQPPPPDPSVAHSSARSGSPQRGHYAECDESRKKPWMQVPKHRKPKSQRSIAEVANREAEKEASLARAKARKAEKAEEERRHAEEEAVRRYYLDIGRRINREL